MFVTARLGRKAAVRSVLLVAALVVTMLAALGTGTASATPGTGDADESATVKTEAKMLLDCTNMSESVHKYAVQHEYCPPAGSGDVSTNGIVYGNCGSSEVYIGDAPGAGWGSVYYGFRSAVGTVVYRNLAVGYAGDDNGGSFGDSGYMFSTSYYAANDVYTGVGSAYASMGGSVTLAWGGVCYLLQPSDSAFIY